MTTPDPNLVDADDQDEGEPDTVNDEFARPDAPDQEYEEPLPKGEFG